MWFKCPYREVPLFRLKGALLRMPFTHSPGIRSMPVHHSVKIVSVSDEKKAKYKRLFLRSPRPYI